MSVFTIPVDFLQDVYTVRCSTRADRVSEFDYLESARSVLHPKGSFLLDGRDCPPLRDLKQLHRLPYANCYWDISVITTVRTIGVGA